MVETDEELVLRVRRGDRDAFSGLVARYERPGLLLAVSILHCWHDARDAVQDAFVVAYERIKRLWSPGKFGAWFLQIVRRRALLQLRRRPRHVTAVQGADVAVLAAEKREFLFDLAELLGRLPRQECAVVTLRHVNELSMGEIALITGQPIGTVTKQLSRAYARMRPWLEMERV